MTSLFESGLIRNKWFDVFGLLRADEPKPVRTNPRRRKHSFAAYCLAGASVVGLNATVEAFAETPPGQASLVWPQAPTAESTKQLIVHSIKQLRTLKKDWNGYESAAPVERSLTAAEYIVPQLPDIVVDAQAGLDADGNVFLRLSRGNKVAYVVIEPKLMHAVVVNPGQASIYLDDEPFQGKILPARIKTALESNFS